MMRRFLAGLALLFALGAPAQAVVAIITGSSTGGSQGNANTASGSATIAVTTTADSPIGSLILGIVGTRSAAGSLTGCVDSASNVYNVINKVSPAAQTGGFFWAVATTDLPIGGTVTCTSGSTLNHGMIVASFSGNAASPLDAASATPSSGTGTAVTAGPTGTLTFPGTTELVVAAFTHHTMGTVTEDAAFTNLGTVTSNSGNVHLGYKIATVNTAVSYAATSGGTSDGWAAYLEAFTQATGGASSSNQGMLTRGTQ